MSKRMKATIGDTVLAESDNTIVIEGNHYFPPDSINKELLTESETTSECPWKGDANYYNVTIDGVEYKDVAWTYHNPKPEAAEIKEHVAFWKDAQVS